MFLGKRLLLVLLVVYFGLFFMLPGYYVFGLHQSFNGFFLRVHEALIYCLTFFLFLLPFMVGFTYLKMKKFRYAIVCLIGGVIAPVFAGIITSILYISGNISLENKSKEKGL